MMNGPPDDGVSSARPDVDFFFLLFAALLGILIKLIFQIE